MSLNILPPELVNCVVANIESRATLCNLAQCSRLFYLCTIPHLYHRLTIQPNAQLRNFASLLIRRPHLAALVRHLTLRDNSGSSGRFENSDYSDYLEEREDFEECVSPTALEVDQGFKTAVHTLSLSREEENNWLRQLSQTRNCRSDLILALLLPALPNLEKLHLDLKMGLHMHYLKRVLRRAAFRERPFDIQPAFETLREFVQSHDISNQWSTGFIALLLKLPAIRVISGELGSNWYDDLGEENHLMELESSSSPLTNLDLAVFTLSTAGLGHILRAPKALKTFFYTSHSCARINFTGIRQALKPQKNCLERLGFDYDDIDGYSYTTWLEQGLSEPMTSFISFNTLKVFKTAAHFLQTTENGTGRHSLINIFPPNLERLHLTRCQDFPTEFLEVIEHLLAFKSPQQIPLLNELILEGRKFRAELWWNMQKAAIKRLSTVTAARGVSIELVSIIMGIHQHTHYC